jgi:hypothetical protein
MGAVYRAGGAGLMAAIEEGRYGDGWGWRGGELERVALLRAMFWRFAPKAQ